MPRRVEEAGEVAVLDHVHHERVAVDVVADVLVIQPRHRPAFERRALGALIPVNHQTMTVGVERGDQDEDDVSQDGEDRRILRGRQGVEELVGGLGGADLGRVDARPDGHDSRLGRREARGFARRERSRMSSRRRMFSGALMMAAIVRWPSLVGPRSIILTRSDSFATRSKYRSIASDPASRPSVPMRKPK